MDNRGILNKKQVILFKKIKELLPDKSLVTVISEQLGLGEEATYRRIRGEVPISFDDAAKLCHHYQISMDSIVDIEIAQLSF